MLATVRMRRHPHSLRAMPSALRVHWSLDPAVTFLNHGSFGACPIPVLAAQQRERDRLEPIHFTSSNLARYADGYGLTNLVYTVNNNQTVS